MSSSKANSTKLESNLELVREVLKIESAAIDSLASNLTDSIDKIIELILDCKGKILVTGMGKMGWVGRKVASTLSSTGTTSVFLHPGEAVHGDLGIVTGDDLLIALSKSGETNEVIQLIPFMARFKIPIIAITANSDSSLALRSQHVIDIGVDKEADMIAQAPTTSTTVSLALCDAIAVALMKRRGFTEQEFAIFHPGGHLGRKLLLTVNDLMHAGDRLPVVGSDETIRAAIVSISQGGLGATLILDEQNKLKGILTDGDLRRSFEKDDNPLGDKISQHMTHHPTSVRVTALAAEALRLMEEQTITVLPVVDDNKVVVGIIHLHDLVRVGLA